MTEIFFSMMIYGYNQMQNVRKYAKPLVQTVGVWLVTWSAIAGETTIQNPRDDTQPITGRIVVTALNSTNNTGKDQSVELGIGVLGTKPNDHPGSAADTRCEIVSSTANIVSGPSILNFTTVRGLRAGQKIEAYCVANYRGYNPNVTGFQPLVWNSDQETKLRVDATLYYDGKSYVYSTTSYTQANGNHYLFRNQKPVPQIDRKGWSGTLKYPDQLTLRPGESARVLEYVCSNDCPPVSARAYCSGGANNLCDYDYGSWVIQPNESRTVRIKHSAPIGVKTGSLTLTISAY